MYVGEGLEAYPSRLDPPPFFSNGFEIRFIVMRVKYRRP